MWLLTNDDGPSEEGLEALVELCAPLLPDASICIPDRNISLCGRAHFGSGALTRTSRVSGLAVRMFDRSPAAIVLRELTVQGHGDSPLIGCVAGVNKGLNLGSDLPTSGTFGAACEAAALGAIGVAISAEEDLFLDDGCILLKRMLIALRELLFAPISPRLRPGCVVNINLPGRWSGRIATTVLSRHTIFPALRDESARGYKIVRRLPPLGSLEQGSDIEAVCLLETVSVTYLDFLPGCSYPRPSGVPII